MLPSHNVKFAEFIRPARHKPEPWRTGVGIVLFIALSTGALYLIGTYGLKLAESYQLGLGYMLAAEWVTQSSKRTVLIALGSIAITLPALWLVLRFVHGRGLKTLIAPNGKVNWRAYLATVGFIVVFAIAAALPEILAGETHQQLPIKTWLVWLLPTIGLIFLQTMTEELVFRGYLLQQFASHFKSRWVWWLVPSLMFGALHYNPIAFGENALLVVATATLLGLILSDITIRTGNLSVAMGLHFANNLTLALLIGIPGQLSALSLFLRDVNLRDIAQTRTAFLLSLGLMLVAYLIYLLVMRRRR